MFQDFIKEMADLEREFTSKTQTIEDAYQAKLAALRANLVQVNSEKAVEAGSTSLINQFNLNLGRLNRRAGQIGVDYAQAKAAYVKDTTDLINFFTSDLFPRTYDLCQEAFKKFEEAQAELAQLTDMANGFSKILTSLQAQVEERKGVKNG